MATAQAVLRIAASVTPAHPAPVGSVMRPSRARRGQLVCKLLSPLWSGTAAGPRATARPPPCLHGPRLPDGSVWSGSIVAATAVAALEVGWRPKPVVETTSGPAICRGQRQVAGCQVTLAQRELRALQDNHDRTSTSWRAVMVDLPQGLGLALSSAHGYW